MRIRAISAEFSVSPQILVSDIQTLADQGFRAIICNRPDGEDAGQPSFKEIKRVAKKLGLEARYLPVSPGMISKDSAVAFADALEKMPSPALAYCRTGTRSTMLWSRSRPPGPSVGDILASARGWALDGLSNLKKSK